MLLEDTRRGILVTPGGWRPDPRASAAMACCAAAIVCLAFMRLLYRPTTGVKPALLSLSVAHISAATSRASHPAPSLTPTTPDISLPHLDPLPPIPGFILLPEQVDGAVRDTVRSGQTGPFLAPPAQKYDELDRALQALPKPGSLRDGEGYRSMYRQTIVKSGDNCTAEQEVQIGPSSGVKARVEFAVACPGEYHPSMADGLAEWARKVAKGNLPPPR